MAIPKTLKAIPKDKAERLVKEHLCKGDGYWESSPMYSDFIYKRGNGYQLLRPPCWAGGQWETGGVSM